MGPKELTVYDTQQKQLDVYPQPRNLPVHSGGGRPSLTLLTQLSWSSCDGRFSPPNPSPSSRALTGGGGGEGKGGGEGEEGRGRGRGGRGGEGKGGGEGEEGRGGEGRDGCCIHTTDHH